MGCVFVVCDAFFKMVLWHVDPQQVPRLQTDHAIVVFGRTAVPEHQLGRLPSGMNIQAGSNPDLVKAMLMGRYEVIVRRRR